MCRGAHCKPVIWKGGWQIKEGLTTRERGI